jgi:hypothetical protein
MSEKKEFNLRPFLFMSCLGFLLIPSCAKYEDFNPKQISALKEESSIEGHFSALLEPMNSSISGNTTGLVKLKLMEDHFSVAVSIQDSPPFSEHYQAIYFGAECPSEADDTNRDGFIDFQEVHQIYKGMLIPLDGNLSGQELGFEILTRSDALGSYNYYQETSFSLLLQDLLDFKNQSTEHFYKLPSLASLKLEGLIIIIHGVSDDVYLPGTIQSFGNFPDRSLVPIACAKVQRGVESNDAGEIKKTIYLTR